MKLTVDTQELNAVLAVASKALSAKSTVSILEGIYMASCCCAAPICLCR